MLFKLHELNWYLFILGRYANIKEKKGLIPPLPPKHIHHHTQLFRGGIYIHFAFYSVLPTSCLHNNNNEKTNNRTRPEGEKSHRVLQEEIVVLMAGVVAGLERGDRPRPLAWHPPLHWPKLAERSAEVTASSVKRDFACTCAEAGGLSSFQLHPLILK